jgi:hypothetical protein
MFAGLRIDKAIGLGDVVKKVTTKMGVAPCGGCRKRAEALNRMVQFVPANAKTRK